MLHALSSLFQDGVLSRALDVGCAVGGSTFELAREFSEVVGMDFSQAFVAKCQELKMTGQASYRLTTEGHLSVRKLARMDPTIVSYNHVCLYCSGSSEVYIEYWLY